MTRIERNFSLADGAATAGLECTNQGVSLAGAPLLKTTVRGFEPLATDELATLAKAAYGRDLDVAAKALNDGDLPRAMIASIQLKLPDLDVDGRARVAAALVLKTCPIRLPRVTGSILGSPIFGTRTCPMPSSWRR
jgi:hypothetical protein